MIDVSAARSRLDMARQADAGAIAVTRAWLEQALAEIEAGRAARARRAR